MDLSSPRPPWLASALFLVVVAVGFLLQTLLGDRKLDLKAGRENAPWIGPNAAWVQQAGTVTAMEASDLATQAIRSVGGRQVERFHGGAVVVGWVGSWWVNIPRWQEYEIAIVITPQEGGESVFSCCARPRWKGLPGLSRSQGLAEALRSQVERLTSHP